MNIKDEKQIKNTDLTRSVDAHLSGTTKTEILVPQVPIIVQLKTETDWPIVSLLVGAGSIFTGIAVALISRANQKSQSRAVMAGLRRDWQTEMRKACTELSSLASLLKYEQILNSDEFPDYNESYQKLNAIVSTIKFLIDPNKVKQGSNNAQSLMRAMERMVDKIHSKEIAEFYDDSREFTQYAQLVLEDAWTDIKNDAYGTDETPWWKVWKITSKLEK